MLKDGKTVYIFYTKNLEKEYIRRMVSIAGNMNVTDLDIAKAIGNLNRYIDDVIGSSVKDIIDECVEVDQRPDMMIVDYVQLVLYDFHNHTAELTRMYELFRKLAQEMNCPIILVSELSRLIEQREDKHPVLSDLHLPKITSVVDNVLLLYRGDCCNFESEKNGVAEFCMAYSKSVQESIVKLNYDYKREIFS